MEEVPGERVGTRRYFHEGYAYHLDVRVGEFANNNIYRCASRTRSQCHGTIRIIGNQIIVVHRHDMHPPNPNIVSEARMKADIFHLVRTTIRGLREIYQEVASRYEETVRLTVTFRSLRSSMDRERARARPPAPRNMVELGELLRDYPTTQNMFRGTVREEDRVVALLFASEGMIRRLNGASELVINCLFQVRLDGMRGFHVLSLYTQIQESMLPCMYVLIDRISESTYAEIWASMFRLAPGLRDTLRTITSSFERELVVSLRRVAPGAAISGTWFFYRQALVREWVHLGLREGPREILWMAVALPLLPVVRFAEALTEIATIGDEVARDNPNVLQFLRYLRIQWLPLSEIVAVHRTSLDISDNCDQLHRYTTANLGGPSRIIWNWLDRLVRVVENGNNNDINGARPVVRRNVLQRTRETGRISQLQDDLSTGRVDITHFLRLIVDRRMREEIVTMIFFNADQDLQCPERNRVIAARIDFGLNYVNAARGVPRAEEDRGAELLEEPNANDPYINHRDVDAPNEAIFDDIISIHDSDDTSSVSDGDFVDLEMLDDDLLVANEADNNNNEPHRGRDDDLPIANQAGINNNNEPHLVLDDELPVAINEADDNNNGPHLVLDDQLPVAINEADDNNNEPHLVLDNDGADNVDEEGNYGHRRVENLIHRSVEAAGATTDVLQLRPCLICLERRPNLLLHPCRHLGLCGDCNTRLERRVCPLCRSEIQSTIKIYFA